jgi:MoaA/NifB/PqqE/SkfB family radical SAM enzyme
MEFCSVGAVYTCCSAHVKHNHYIGNAYEQSFDEIWNSDNAKKLRYSVSCGDFEYCNSICPWMNEGNYSESRYFHPIIQRGDTKYKFFKWQECEINAGPEMIALSCDDTCNLSCRSCRGGVRTNSKEEDRRLLSMLMNVVRPALKNCKALKALGSGEFFVSKSMREFFTTLTPSEFPLLKLEIVTNGQLLTQENWERFSNLKGMVESLFASIDAADKDTYEYLRRGGKWENLCANMEFASALKRSREIKRIVLNFVLQKENCNQILDVIMLAKKWDVDQISFQRLANWGTYSPQEYMELDVFNPSNKYFYEVRNLLEKAKTEGKKLNIEIVENATTSN